MPYSVTTKDGLTLTNIPDNLAPDSPEVLAGVKRLRERDQSSVSKERLPTLEEQGFTFASNSNMGEDILKGFGSGIAGMLESSALGMATILEEEAELKARSKIQDLFDIDMLKGADEDSVAFKLSAGIGSIAALAPAAFTGAAALPLAGAVAAGAGAGEASERARAYGATEDERGMAAVKGTFIGALELTPLGRLSKAFKLPGLTATLDKLGPKAIDGIVSRVRNAGVTGLAEGAQEGAAAILQNLNEQGYNAEKELVDSGVLEEALIGGGAGAILQALADVLSSGVIRGKGSKASTAGGTGAGTAASAELEAAAKAIVEAERLGATTTEKEVSEADLDAVTGEKTRQREAIEKNEAEARDLAKRLAAESDAIPFGEEGTVTFEANVPLNNEQQVAAEVAAEENATSSLFEEELGGVDETNVGKVDEGGGGGSLSGATQAPSTTEEVTTGAKEFVGGRVGSAKQGPTNTFVGKGEQLTPVDIVARQEQVATIQLAVDKKGLGINVATEITNIIATDQTYNDAVKQVMDKVSPPPAEAITQKESLTEAQELELAAIEAGESRNSLATTTNAEQRRKRNAALAEEQRVLAAKNAALVGKEAGKPLVNSVDADKKETDEAQKRALAAGKPPANVSVDPDLPSGTNTNTPMGRADRAAIDAQATANKIITPTSVEPVVTPEGGTRVESPDAVVLVDKSFVLSLGLTGKYEPIGDVLIEKFGENAPESITNGELAKTMKASFGRNKSPAKLPPQTKGYIDKYTTPVVDDNAQAPDLDDGTAAIASDGRQASLAKKIADAKLANTKEARKQLEEAAKVEAGIGDAEAVAALEAKIADIGQGLDLNNDSQLPNAAVNWYEGVVPPDVKALLVKGDLRGALMALSVATTDPRIKQITRVLSEAVGDANIKFVKGTTSSVSADGTVNLVEGEVGIHTLLHESTHAVIDTTLDNPSSPFTKKMTTLFNEVKPQLDSAYGAQNLKEFVAEVLSNSAFQQKLAGMNPDGSKISSLSKFFRYVTNLIRTLIGSGTKTTGSALDVVDQHIMAILSTSPDTRGAGSTYGMATRDGVQKLLKDMGLVQKGFAAPTPKFRKDFGEEGARWFDGLGDSANDIATRIGALRLLDTQALGDVAKAKGYGDLGDRLHTTLQEMRGAMNAAERIINTAVEKASKWAMANPAEQKKIDDIIYSSDKADGTLGYGATIYQIDPMLDLQTATERYGKDPDKLARWKKLKREWDSLSDQGRNQYKEIRDVYKVQYEQLRRVITKRVDEVFGEGSSEALNIKNNIFSKMFDQKTLDVYFPLVREGKFKLTYTPVATDSNTSDRDSYVVEMFESKAEMLAARERVESGGLAMTNTIETSEGDLSASNFRKNAPDGDFVKDILNALESKGVDSEVQDEIMNLFIDSLPSTAFAKSFKNRGGYDGYIPDAIHSMRAKSFDLARQIKRIDYSSRIRTIVGEIKTVQLKLSVNNSTSNTTTAIGDDLIARATFATSGADLKSIEGYVKNINQVAFIYTIGFNASSALVNLSQLPLFVGPMLGAEFGHIKTGKVMTEAMSLVKSSGNNIDSYFDIAQDNDVDSKTFGEVTYTLREGLDPKIVAEYGPLTTLITMASKRSYLTQSYISDAMGLDENTSTFEFIKDKLGKEKSGRIDRGNAFQKGLNTVSSTSAIMFNAGERFNRQVTLLAAYKLSLEDMQAKEAKKPKDARKSNTEMELAASEDALYKSMEYNGGAVLETGSRISAQGAGRVAFMYKNYGLRMYTTMFKTGKRAIELQFYPPKNETAPQKEERLRQKKIAWAQVRAVQLSSLLVAGVAGMPLYGIVTAAIDLTLDDDEDDSDTVVRKYLGEGWYKGPAVAALGVDFSKRVRLNSLLFEANRYSKDPSLEESFFHYFGGPAASTILRGARSVKDFSDGEVERGIESALPAGLTNILRNSPIGRFQKEDGMRTRRGDVIYDDVTAGDFFAGMIGFPPAGYTFAQEQTNVEQRISGAVTKERSKLMKRYYQARRDGDYPEGAAVFKEMMAFGKEHPTAAINYDSLKRSYNGHQRTTAKMHNGTTISPMMKRVLEEERKNYSMGFFD